MHLELIVTKQPERFFVALGIEQVANHKDEASTLLLLREGPQAERKRRVRLAAGISAQEFKHFMELAFASRQAHVGTKFCSEPVHVDAVQVRQADIRE